MNKHIIVASHRRSGTHMLIDSLVNNFKTFQDNPHIQKMTLDHYAPHIGKSTSKINVLQEKLTDKSYLFKTHSHANIDSFFGEKNKCFWNIFFENSKVIYIYRDGRDVLLSQFYYQQKFDSSLLGISVGDYIKQNNNFDASTYENSLSRIEYWAYHIRSWNQKKNCLFISFESLKNNYESTLFKISDFIDEPISKELKDIRMQSRRGSNLLQKIAQKANIGKIKRSSVGFRKGISGGWKNKFSSEDLEYFDKYSGFLLQDLGYKTSE